MFNKILIPLFFLCSFTTFLSAQSSGIVKEDLIKDLDVYRDSLWLKHINAFNNISRGDFSKGIEWIKELSASMNADELFVQLLKLNAKIQDEHTSIGILTGKFFPLSLYWFDEGMYILTADTEYRDIGLSRIIAINNSSIADATKKISEIIPGNNSHVKKMVPEYLCSPIVLHGFQIIDQTDSVILTVVNLKGDTIKKKIMSKISSLIKFDTLPVGDAFLRNRSRDNYWYKYDSLTNSLYFHYMRCWPDKQKPFKKFQGDLFAELDARQAKRLIIDLRYNGGGYSQLLNPVIERLWKTTIRRQRELFVLVGRRTFSSEVLNAFDLKTKDDAILVGEETGGNVNHFGEINYFELPHTKIKVSYSTKYFLKDKSQTGSLKPDVTFPMKFSDFINGIDGALNYAETH